jgi:hypothetical protein
MKDLDFRKIGSEVDYRQVLLEVESLMSAGRCTLAGDRLGVFANLAEEWKSHEGDIDDSLRQKS